MGFIPFAVSNIVTTDILLTNSFRDFSLIYACFSPVRLLCKFLESSVLTFLVLNCWPALPCKDNRPYDLPRQE